MPVAQVPRSTPGSEPPCDAEKGLRASHLRRYQAACLDGVLTRKRRSMAAAPASINCKASVRLERLRLSIQACTRCDALVRCRSRVVPGDGSVPADVAFVGIAPGRFGGDRTGIPFSGDRSGHLLRRMIERSRLQRVFVTNLVRCNPRDDAGRNRDPNADEIANCRAHLRAEFALARPLVVACLGRMAWKELAGRAAPFVPRQGKPALVEGLRLFPMYHPAFVNRGAYPLRLYMRDFARLTSFVRTHQK
jgi:uracil-DNA glycosylase family 4